MKDLPEKQKWRCRSIPTNRTCRGFVADRIARRHPVRGAAPASATQSIPEAAPGVKPRFAAGGTSEERPTCRNLKKMISSVPTIGSLSAAIDTTFGATAVSGLSYTVPNEPAAPPAYSLQHAEVAQYSKNVYSVLLNGLTAQLGPDGTSVGGSIARESLLGPFGTPPPPAGTAAGIPYSPGADHNDYAAQVMASLRSLAGNGQIFQTDGSKKH